MSKNSPLNSDPLTRQQQHHQLLQAAIRLNTWLLAGVFGCVFGLSLFGLTYLSLWRGLPHPGRYLNLLGVFLPGYDVSVAGAWAGLFWGAVLGALLAVLIYRVYARSMAAQIHHFLNSETATGQLTGATLQLDGKSLGIALGAVLAGGLIVTTNWLVFRGTASESVHALLLVNYLPGYAINLSGSIIGALELFVLTYSATGLFSKIYNHLALPGSGEPQ